MDLPPLVEIRENPEFHDLVRMDKGHWPRCLLWHGWLPVLSGVGGASPCAADASGSAGHLGETARGPYSPGLISEWSIPDEFDAVEAASRVPGALMSAIWVSGWMSVPASAISADDVVHWPYTPGLVVKCVAFLGLSSLACWWFGSWSWCFLCGISHSL